MQVASGKGRHHDKGIPPHVYDQLQELSEPGLYSSLISLGSSALYNTPPLLVQLLSFRYLVTRYNSKNAMISSDIAARITDAIIDYSLSSTNPEFFFKFVMSNIDLATHPLSWPIRRLLALSGWNLPAAIDISRQYSRLISDENLDLASIIYAHDPQLDQSMYIIWKPDESLLSGGRYIFSFTPSDAESCSSLTWDSSINSSIKSTLKRLACKWPSADFRIEVFPWIQERKLYIIFQPHDANHSGQPFVYQEETDSPPATPGYQENCFINRLFGIKTTKKTEQSLPHRSGTRTDDNFLATPQNSKATLSQLNPCHKYYSSPFDHTSLSLIETLLDHPESWLFPDLNNDNTSAFDDPIPLNSSEPLQAPEPLQGSNQLVALPVKPDGFIVLDYAEGQVPRISLASNISHDIGSQLDTIDTQRGNNIPDRKFIVSVKKLGGNILTSEALHAAMKYAIAPMADRLVDTVSTSGLEPLSKAKNGLAAEGDKDFFSIFRRETSSEQFLEKPDPVPVYMLKSKSGVQSVAQQKPTVKYTTTPPPNPSGPDSYDVKAKVEQTTYSLSLKDMLFICSKCNKFLYIPVQQTSVGDMVHKDCGLEIIKLLQQKKPIEGYRLSDYSEEDAITLYPDKARTRELQNKEFLCSDCEAHIKNIDLELFEHAKTHIVQCSKCNHFDAPDANLKERTSALATHQANGCKIGCKFCNALFAWEALENHQDACPRKTVSCQACKETLQLADYAKHVREKKHEEAPCPVCQAQIKALFFPLHMANEHFKTSSPALPCPLDTNCPKFDTHLGLLEHIDTIHTSDMEKVIEFVLSGDQPDEKYKSIVTLYLQVYSEKPTRPDEHSMSSGESTRQELEQFKGELGAMTTIIKSLPQQQKESSQSLQQTQSQLHSLTTQQQKLEQTQTALKQLQDQLTKRVSQVEIDPMQTKRETKQSSESAGSNPEQLQQVIKRYESLEREVTRVKLLVSDLELQLQASLASTHNGAFLWRIPDIAKRKRDAIEERVTSIYSPPFYTGRNGYKMCIRTYLNGDGIGYKTHLGVFFVLMKGEFDPLLKWPFDHKVSMILVDQTHRKHIVQTFRPTPDSSSFQQPMELMNVASGCPQFAKLTALDDDNYIKNDVIYIKCIVDTTQIFHP